MATTPLIALTLGDPAGIGPEICLAALEKRELRDSMRLLLIGPASLRPASVPEGSTDHDFEALEAGSALWIPCEDFGEWRMGEIQESCGRTSLSSLRIGHELALAGRVDALVTGPVCKESLHLAGEAVEGQTELLGKWCGVDDHQMLAIAGKLRVLLLSRHLPLREALDLVTEERVLQHLELLHRGLVELGFEAPRLALAGLNPHAGENSILGTEDARILEPAARRAVDAGIDVTGPVSPDVVFANGAAGDFDGVLALYHDQAFIPIKLLGEGCGMTVLVGLPYLRMSPAHGVAFDLAGQLDSTGQGKARSSDLEVTLGQAAEWCRERSATS